MNPLKLSNELYNYLKYICLIGLPALATFIGVMGGVWDISHTDQVVKSVIAFNVLLSSLVVVGNIAYNNSDARFDGTIDPQYADAQTSDQSLNFGASAEKVAEQKEVLLKVNPVRAP